MACVPRNGWSRYKAQACFDEAEPFDEFCDSIVPFCSPASSPFSHRVKTVGTTRPQLRRWWRAFRILLVLNFTPVDRRRRLWHANRRPTSSLFLSREEVALSRRQILIHSSSR